MISAISSHKNCFRFSPTILLALDRRRKTASKIDLERERETKRRESASERHAIAASATDGLSGGKEKKRKTLK
jgi:hypothetical protein